MSLRSARRWLRKVSLEILTSIAFIPSIFAVGFLLLAFITLYIDESSPERLISYSLSVTNIIHPDSARTLLGATTGGMISLMVFSFSMVMIVLNQAASNYSPRVLPGFIGRRFHQVIMGTYLGTILYSIAVLSSIQSHVYTFQVPHLSMLLTILFSVMSLAMFIAFVHSISEHIQIGNIIRNLYEDTLQSLEKYLEKSEMVPEEDLPSSQNAIVIRSPTSGYLNSLHKRSFQNFSKKIEDITIWMLVPWGVYMHQNQPILKVNRTLSEEETNALLDTFIFKTEEIISLNHVFGFKQLTEIAVKALSPGINDPGTAIESIDRLCSLFNVQMNDYQVPVITNDKGALQWVGRPVDFSELFGWCWNEIRVYASEDAAVLFKLVEWAKVMIANEESERYNSAIAGAILELIEHINLQVKNSLDRKKLMHYIDQTLTNASNQSISEQVRERLQATISSGHNSI